MATYRRTLGQYTAIGRRERKFRNEVIETESITEEYVEYLKRRVETPPPPTPKARLIKRPNAGRREN